MNIQAFSAKNPSILKTNWPEITKEEFEQTIDLSATKEIAKYKLVIHSNRYEIIYTETGKSLIEFEIQRHNLAGQTNEEFAAALLQHIANWERMQSLANPFSTLIWEKDQVQVNFRVLNKSAYFEDDVITLDYYHISHLHPKPLEFELCAINHSSKPLILYPYIHFPTHGRRGAKHSIYSI